MVVHHVCTITLFVMSWTANMVRIGTLVLCVHDAVDYFLEVYIYNTHTHTLNGPLSGTTQVGRYQKGKTNLDFTVARDSEWQWHQLGRMQVCTSLQTRQHPTTQFLQAGCPSCPTNSVKA